MDNQLNDVEQKQFRKANEIISPRVARGGTLSLLGRKIFNVLLYHMQRMGEPGVDAPDGDPLHETLYWLPLAELARDAAFNSEDTALLKEAMLKLQDIKIITDDKKGFSSDVLIASVKIIPGKSGQKTMLGWGMHPVTESILKNPSFYTRLSIYYLTRLRTTSGMALYENCKRYLTNPGKLTRRENWEWWHDVLTGHPVNQEKPEYKYFKRDILKVAIAEVNTTDICVELIEHKNGRRVVDLQFKVDRTEESDSVVLAEGPIVDNAILQRVIALGFTRNEAETVMAKHKLELVDATLSLVENRILDKNLPSVVSRVAFFKTALKQQFVATTPTKTPTVILPPILVKESSPEEKQQATERAKVLKHYDGLSLEKQEELFQQFLLHNSNMSIYAKKSPTGRIVRTALAQWLMLHDMSQ